MMTSIRKNIKGAYVLGAIGAVLCAAVLLKAFSHRDMLELPYLRVAPEPGEELAGGATTVHDTGRTSFGRSLMNMDRERWDRFFEGKGVFDRDWSRISSKVAHPPAGPFFSAPSCKGCHERDGRGHPPLREGDVPASMVFQLAMERAHGSDGADGSTDPDPIYGDQFHYRAVEGRMPRGTIDFSVEDIDGEFADGEEYRLQRSIYRPTRLGYGALDPRTRLSPRVAPAVFGLGLLEAVPEEAILALADPDDRDGDGISGRPNYVVSVREGRPRLGRYGWKANQPSLEQQIARAFLSDMGMTTHLYPLDPGAGVIVTVGNNAAEVGIDDFETVLHYTRLLAPPARRRWASPDVLRGKAIFSQLQCAGCHIPTLRTAEARDIAELSHQTIHPYTDLLLHDMGEGLADGSPDGLASGREWRTPPLWGIGLVQSVNRHSRFLHDGRARSLEEAILWHGGEASAAQHRYVLLRKEDRSALLAFLESL